MNPGLGLSLLLAGLAVIALVWLFLRMLPRPQAERYDSQAFSHSESSNDAIVILQPGGRVEFISDHARSFFGLRENEPYDLERLARHVRPSDDFLDLCVASGSKRVSIGGRLVELASYEVPGSYPRMLISLREKEAPSTLEAGNGESSETLRMATEFSQSIAASLNLDTTVRSIMDHVSRLIPSDVFELKLWNEERRALIPYRLQRSSTGRLVTSSLSQFGVLTGQLVERRAPVMLEDVRSQLEPSSNNHIITIQSYLGIPLIAAGELVGTIEAGQMNRGSFGQHDLELLTLISGQAAIAIRNAKLYEEEQNRGTELAGLANLNQALGSVREVHEIFTRLVESVSPLFKTEIIGFLLYDEDKRTLEGKNPFKGLPSNVVEIYRSNIPVGSPAETIITSNEPIITMNALEDERWRALGLMDVATAASLRDNALVPLLSSGRMLGYFQIGHHHRGASPFTSEELRLMNIVANQAAAIIENILLVQQARSRAQRADALRRIASLSSSSATLEEILKYSVQELAHLFQADMGAIFLLDEARGMLRLRRESTFGVPDDISSTFIQIFVDDPNYRYTVSGSRKPFLTGGLSTERRVLPAYRPLATALMIESAIVVPLVVRERSIGELMLGSYKPNLFNSFDLQVIATAAGQVASAVESAGLLVQTDDTLRTRVDQLSAIMRIGRELGASLDLKHLLQVTQDEAVRAMHADCAAVILLDHEFDPSDPHIQMMSGCSHPQKLTPAERTALKSGEPHLVSDYSQGNISSPHEGVLSALIVPIKYQADAVGLLVLHSSRPGFFKQESLELGQMLASQAGIAFNNARRYQAEKQRSELVRRRAETLQHLGNVNYNLIHDQPLEQALQIIARGIREATPFRVVLISMVEQETAQLKRITGVGIPQETLIELLSRKQPLASIQQMMRPEFKVSHSYFIPADKAPVIPPELHSVTLDVSTSAPVKADDPSDLWKSEDFFLVPLENAEGEIIGLISLDDPANGLRPDRAAIEAVEVFATQSSFLISNILRQTDLRGRIDSLTSALERQQKLIEMSQDDLPILLRKDLEQTISLHNLDRRAQRIRAGLAITESVSRQLDASSALSALGRETLTQLGMSVALVAENTAEGPHLMHVLGSLPRSTNVESLFGQRNPLRACLQTGTPILIPNLDEEEEWRDAALLTSLRAKGVICLPILVEQKPVAAMLGDKPGTPACLHR
jgi:GAF domain-containing protein